MFSQTIYPEFRDVGITPKARNYKPAPGPEKAPDLLEQETWISHIAQHQGRQDGVVAAGAQGYGAAAIFQVKVSFKETHHETLTCLLPNQALPRPLERFVHIIHFVDFQWQWYLHRRRKREWQGTHPRSQVRNTVAGTQMQLLDLGRNQTSIGGLIRHQLNA
jgi:hypothetical protein